MEIVYGNNIVYAQNKEQMRDIINEQYQIIFKIQDRINEMLTVEGEANKNFKKNSQIENIQFVFYQDERKSSIEVRKFRANQYAYMIIHGIDGEMAELELAKKIVELLILPRHRAPKFSRASKTYKLYGFIRQNESGYIYGSYATELIVELLAKYSLSDKSFDDVLLEFAKEKPENLLIALLLVAGKNDYEFEINFKEMTNHKLDLIIKNAEGKTEPLNLMLYGFLNDSAIVEKDFNRYMGEQKWRVLMTVFEEIKTGNYENYYKALNTVKYYTDKRIKYKYHSAVKRLGKSRVPDLKNKAKLVERMLKD